jgi:hypothetical protein
MWSAWLIASPLGNCQDGEGTTSKYCDDLGRCFAAYTNDDGIRFGIAIPEAKAAPFDIIVQITAPLTVGWVGLAWGGAMTYNPLILTWPNGTIGAISSRMAL